MRICLTLILTIVVFGCNGTKNLTTLSELRIENRKSNNLIVNRKPDFKFDGGDGDVILDEISMDIDIMTEKQIVGKVFDSKTKEPLCGANLDLVIIRNGKSELVTIKTDSQGKFNSNLNGLIEGIEVHYIAYRDLKIKLKK